MISVTEKNKHIQIKVNRKSHNTLPQLLRNFRPEVEEIQEDPR